MTGRILIDTNAYSALMSGNSRVAAELAQSEAVLLSPIVVGELLEGFRRGGRHAENWAILSRFREKPRTVLTTCKLPIPKTRRSIARNDTA